VHPSVMGKVRVDQESVPQPVSVPHTVGVVSTTDADWLPPSILDAGCDAMLGHERRLSEGARPGWDGEGSQAGLLLRSLSQMSRRASKTVDSRFGQPVTMGHLGEVGPGAVGLS
jgi:hypothetical protein